jgi:subtilisin
MSKATNFAIAKAIDQAVRDKCDLINMSLGGGAPDPLVEDAIAEARAAGALVIIASGNEGRKPVSFPANHPLAVAVSAMGRTGTFPPDTPQAIAIDKPFGSDKREFIATFSNIGTQTALTGPGVGIVSTVPGGYAVMDGTSMACPAATGVAAVLLGTDSALLARKRDQSRSDEIARLVLARAKPRGFGPEYEGQGLPLLP